MLIRTSLLMSVTLFALLGSGCAKHHGRAAPPVVRVPGPLPADAAAPDAGVPVTLDAPPVLEIGVSIAAVTLGDECAMFDTSPRSDGDCADDECGFCEQTAVQLTITRGAGGATARFEVVSIELLETDGTPHGELGARDAHVFRESAYEPWDQLIAPSSELHVSYDTDAPDWVTIGGGDPWTTYGMLFQIVMTVRVDGELRVLRFSPAIRQSLVDT